MPQIIRPSTDVTRSDDLEDVDRAATAAVVPTLTSGLT